MSGLGRIGRIKMSKALNTEGLTLGDTVPATGTSGYKPGSKFIKTDVHLGQTAEWVNIGTEASCLFVPEGICNGYGVHIAGGPVTSVGGDTTENIALQGLITDTDIAIVGHEVSDDDDQIVAAIADEDKINITVSADPSTAHGYVYAALRNNCIPGWDIVAAGTYDAVADDDATIAIDVPGVSATDIAFANYIATDDTDTISDVVCTEDTVTITASADPVTDHSFSYVVIRPRGTFKPSHYIGFAGVHTTVGGAAAEEIAISGALTTDIPIVVYNTTDDTDSILSVAVTEDTLTVTCSADPGETHKLAYMLFRAY